jgi:hypothetical protein
MRRDVEDERSRMWSMAVYALVVAAGAISGLLIGFAAAAGVSPVVTGVLGWLLSAVPAIVVLVATVRTGGE